MLRQVGDEVCYAGQERQWRMDHATSHVDDGGDVSARNSAVADLDGGLDHREGESFDAVPEVGQIPAFGGVEFLGVPILAVRGEQLHVLLLSGDEEIFVGPQRVVGIECNGCNVHNHIVRRQRTSFKQQSEVNSRFVTTYVNSWDGIVDTGTMVSHQGGVMQRFRLMQFIMAIVTFMSVLMPSMSTAQASTGVGTQIFDTTGTSTRFVDVVVGDNHTCALKANGTVMCWGYNGEGQLGIGDGYTRYSLVPIEVPGITTAVAIAAGSNNTCVILRDASLSCWGYGNFGDGNGLYVRWSAGVIAGMRDVTQIAMSNRGSCLYNKYSQLICWGDNYSGYSNEYWLVADGTSYFNWPRLITTDSFTNIAIRNIDRYRRTCVQRTDGRVACIGVNADGALGLGFTSTYNHNGYSVVGLGNYVNKFAMGANGGCAILTDKTVSCWGSFAGGYESTARNIPMPEPIADVYGSTNYRYWLKGVSGKIYAVGDNWGSALGVNSNVTPWNIITEVPEIFGATRVAGADHMHGCAVLPSGRIKCWGQNSNGQLGNGTQTGAWVPVNIALPGEPIIGSTTTSEDTLSGLMRIRRHPEDGAETSHVRITRVLNGRLFKPDGVTAIAAGSYLTMAEAESGVRFLPDTNINGPNIGAVAIQASTKPNITGVSASVVTGTITVSTIADAPLITNADTYEDTQSYDGLVIQRNAADGPEVTHAVITNIVGGQLYRPDGTTPLPNGSIIDLVTAAQGLRFTPEPNRTLPGSVEVRAATSGTGEGLSVPATASITIFAVVDGAPSITGTTVREDEMGRPDIVITKNVIDGDEIRAFRVVSNAPGRFYLSDGVTMVLNGGFVSAASAANGIRFRPNPNVFGSYTIQTQAATSPTVEGIGGDVATAAIIITPVADAPRITGTTVAEGGLSETGLVVLPNSADGAEVTHFRIASVVGGTLFLADGMSSLSVGQFITVAQGAAGLKFAAPIASIGNGMVEVQAATAAALTATTATRATAMISISDKTAPDILVPYDMILDAYTDTGTRVDFTVSASDLRDGIVPVTCSYVSGVYLPVGTHTITCSASDRSGNQASASFIVIVQKIASSVTLSPIGAVSGQNVSLRWALGVETGQAYRFDIQRRALPSGEWMLVAQNVSERSATVRSMGELVYAFRLRATLPDGTTGPWSNIVNTVIDETAPNVSAWINRGPSTLTGAEATTSSRVRLTMQNSDADPATLVRWSEDGLTYSSWIPYRSINEVTLSVGDGYKELHIEARDRVGNVTTTYTGIILNTTVTDAYSVTMNNGDSFTSSNTVNVSVTAPRSVITPIAEMQFSTTGVFDGSQPWQPFALGGTWTFEPTTSGMYRLYIRFRNVDGTILQVVQDDILVDSTAPVSTLSIRSTTAASVTIALSSSDRATSSRAAGSGVTQMQIASAGAFGSASWLRYATTATVSYDKANKSAGGIYARFRDRAGNVSATRCISPTGTVCSVNPAYVSNAIPVIRISTPYRIASGAVIILSERLIDASDSETPQSQLSFTLLTEPVNGWMLYGGSRMSAGTRFTLADLARKRVVYRQNGTNSEHDRIVIQVTDARGAHASATVWFLINGVTDPELPATPEPTVTVIPTSVPTSIPTMTPTRTPTRKIPSMTPTRTPTRKIPPTPTKKFPPVPTKKARP